MSSSKSRDHDASPRENPIAAVEMNTATIKANTTPSKASCCGCCPGDLDGPNHVDDAAKNMLESDEQLARDIVALEAEADKNMLKLRAAVEGLFEKYEAQKHATRLERENNLEREKTIDASVTKNPDGRPKAREGAEAGSYRKPAIDKEAENKEEHHAGKKSEESEEKAEINFAEMVKKYTDKTLERHLIEEKPRDGYYWAALRASHQAEEEFLDGESEKIDAWIQTMLGSWQPKVHADDPERERKLNEKKAVENCFRIGLKTFIRNMMRQGLQIAKTQARHGGATQSLDSGKQRAHDAK